MLSAILAAWVFDAGKRMAGFDRDEFNQIVEKLRADNQALENEVERLSGLLTASEGGVQIEQAAQKLLSEKNKLLSEENAKLREELAVFEKISKLEGNVVDEVSLDQLSIRHETQGVYRYSFLIALHGGRRGRENRFDLQALAIPRSGIQSAVVLFERTKESAPGQYEIVMRNFRRIDGKIQLPKDFLLGSLEIRILEKGSLKASSRIASENMSNVQ